MWGSLTVFLQIQLDTEYGSNYSAFMAWERRSIRVSFVDVTCLLYLSQRPSALSILHGDKQKQKNRKWLNFHHFCLKTKLFISIFYSYIMEQNNIDVKMAFQSISAISNTHNYKVSKHVYHYLPKYQCRFLQKNIYVQHTSL